MLKRGGLKGQLTIFIIIAIILVAGIGVYFLLKGRISFETMPSSLKPVEEYFLGCIDEQTKEGISLLEDRGGYIYPPDFVPGNEYAPSSNQLSFFGSSIPYWYYASGKLVKEQIPSKKELEKQLSRYIEENFKCDFSSFYNQGFAINLSDLKAEVSVLDNKVDVTANADLDIGLNDNSARQSSHKVTTNSELGNLYNSALQIYNKEKKEAFLENYALDVLYSYAPVNGVEISCSPKIWLLENVTREIKQALEANMQAITFSGAGYFKQNLDINKQTSFLYSGEWPTRIEIWDSSNGVMLAKPIGNQAGLGILGFCYVPYHFVYDLVYPVLIRVYDNKENFQFPVVVIIEGNKARQALASSTTDYAEPELCKYKNSEISVYTYDINLEPVEADISFSCLSQQCDIGKTARNGSEAVLVEKMPECVNGWILASAEGYADKKVLVSTNQEGAVNIILDKLYDLNVKLKVDGKESEDYAIITFDSGDTQETVAYPQQKSVSLPEGLYNVSVYVYKNSSINIPATKKEICNEVPKSGVLGILGLTEEKCFNVDLPSQTLNNVIAGGGKSPGYFIESELKKGNLEINVDSMPIPASLEQLQDSYNLLEVKSVDLEFS